MNLASYPMIWISAGVTGESHRVQDAIEWTAGSRRPEPRGKTSMAITYEEATAKLHEWTSSPALRNHARGVEAAMRRAAHRYGGGAADELRWAIAGLLHDADYDRWPAEHPRLIVAWRREQGE